MENRLDIINNQIQGYTAAIAQYRDQEKIFLKAQGIREQINGLEEQANTFQKDAEDEKEKRAGLLKEKAVALSPTIDAIAEKMTAALPVGNPVIEIGEGSTLLIGWEIDGVLRPYDALSGGEKVSFDSALALALGANIIIQEAAELDDKRFGLSLDKLTGLETQVICLACRMPPEVSEGWDVVAL